MLDILLVGIGGFFGSILRYITSGLIFKFLGKPYLPYGTVCVNIVGCLLIGFLSGCVDHRHLFNREIRIFTVVGLLGGFTTFSTFGLDVFTALRDGQFINSFSNIMIHIIFGITSVWFGYYLSKFV